MTIEKGKEWGRVVNDHGGGEPLNADMCAELGLDLASTGSNSAGPWRELPLDLLRVALTLASGDVITFTTATHVVAGSRMRGRYSIVSSTSFVRRRRMFARAHPNDGRLDWLELDQSMGVRQRILFFRRTRTETHLPHPDVRIGSADSYRANFERPLRVRSKVSRRNVISLSVEIIPDGSVVYVPVSHGQ